MVNRSSTVTGHCQRGECEKCDGAMRTGTGWNWWCTHNCHPEPTLADAAPNSGAEKAIAFWRAHRAPDPASSSTETNPSAVDHG